MEVEEFILEDQTPRIIKRRIGKKFKDIDLYFYKVNPWGVYYDMDVFGEVPLDPNDNGFVQDRLGNWIRFSSPVYVIGRGSWNGKEARLISLLKEDETIVNLKIPFYDDLDGEDLIKMLLSYGVSLKDVPDAKKHLINYIREAVGTPQVFGL